MVLVLPHTTTTHGTRGNVEHSFQLDQLSAVFPFGISSRPHHHHQVKVKVKVKVDNRSQPNNNPHTDSSVTKDSTTSRKSLNTILGFNFLFSKFQ
jgi:hypothetical protein